MLKKVFSLSIFLLFIGSFCFSQQDSLTITAYYPAPFGTYNELTVANRQAIGDVNADHQVNRNDLARRTGSNAPLNQTLTVASGVAINQTTLGTYGAGAGQHSTRLDLDGYIAANDIWLEDVSGRIGCRETAGWKWESFACRGWNNPKPCPPGMVVTGARLKGVSEGWGCGALSFAVQCEVP
jgi:hypothetical protein